MVRAVLIVGWLLLLSGVIFYVNLSRKQERQIEPQAAKLKELESRLQKLTAATADQKSGYSPMPVLSRMQAVAPRQNLPSRQASLLVCQSSQSAKARGSATGANQDHKSGSLRDQITCAQQGERAFQSDESKLDRGDLKELFSHFTTHYQRALDGCFIEINRFFTSADGQTALNTQTVSDAISGELVGMYMSRNHKIEWCDMVDPNGKTSYCESEDEFKQLARQYTK